MKKVLADLWLPIITEDEEVAIIDLANEILLAPGTSVRVTLNTFKGPAVLSASLSEGDIDSVQMKYDIDDHAPMGMIILVVEEVEWQE